MKKKIIEIWNSRDIISILDELSTFIDTILPTIQEEKENAEVPTPKFLRREMLLNLDFNKIKNNDSIIFEPCVGKGGFLIDILYSFKPKNFTEYKNILQKKVYFNDLNNNNIKFCKFLLDPFDEIDFNSYNEDFLSNNFSFEKNENEKKPIIIVTNPPYNLGYGKQSSPLFDKFIIKCLDIIGNKKGSKLLGIIPSYAWFMGGKGLESFREKMMNIPSIKLIKHKSNSTEWFKGHHIPGGVNYFLIDNNYEGNCSFTNDSSKTVDISLKKMFDNFGAIIDPKALRVINKINKKTSSKLIDLYLPRNYYDISSNDQRLDEKKGTKKCYVSSLKNKSRIMFINYDIPSNKKHYKVITNFACGNSSGINSKFHNFFILNSNEVYNDSYIGFRTNSKEESENLISYLNCKLPNYLLNLLKVSHLISMKTCQLIPLVPLDRKWNDELVKKYFDL